MAKTHGFPVIFPTKNNPMIWFLWVFYSGADWNHRFFMTFHIWGISSSQLTNSIIFQRGWLKPPTSIPIYNLHVLFNYVDSKTVCHYDALLFTSIVVASLFSAHIPMVYYYCSTQTDR